MENWYTIGIVFLAGLAAGLLGFLYIQPAQTGYSKADTSTSKSESTASEQITESSGATDSNESTNNSETRTPSTDDEQTTEPSQTEEWQSDVDTSSTPKLIFYYKPG